MEEQEQSLIFPPSKPSLDHKKEWIRGVNLGGWLLIERYIVPYLFAVTDCHLRGDLCWYPGQLSVNPKTQTNYQICDLYDACRPHLRVPSTGGEPDYPLDEYTLAEAFLNANRKNANDPYRNEQGLQIAETWFNAHFDNFIQERDIEKLKQAGLTHVRVPLPHWILGGVETHEPWIVGRRWQNFLKLCKWARKYQLQVWPDIHTSPGSQNGFDNSGQALHQISCQGWSAHAKHVNKTLGALQTIATAVVDAGYDDVVTGFGLLNEPFKDCDRNVYFKYMDKGKQLVREILGPHVHVYVSDMFLADTFNDGHWWLETSNTYLDSHYYQVFAEYTRELSPRQHIAYTCQNTWRDTTSCCYQDPHVSWWSKLWNPKTVPNSEPSQGVQRIVGEWSAAYDTMPSLRLFDLMMGIAHNGTLPDYDRKLSNSEIDFVKHYVQAQMVTYEAAETGVSAGWFYWTAKMEGGAFAEWDFTRGLQEGWIPTLPDVDQTSQEVYGTCYDIIFATKDDETIIDPYPHPDDLPDGTWMGDAPDDDVVVSHGQSLMERDGIHHRQRYDHFHYRHHHLFLWTVGALALAMAVRMTKRYYQRQRKQAQYTELAQHHPPVSVHHV